MTKKRYNTYCDQNENRTAIDDDLTNNHIFIAYCGELEDAIRLKIALNSVTDELNRLHEENQRLKKLNIPIDEIKDTVSDYRGRIIGVYYND